MRKIKGTCLPDSRYSCRTAVFIPTLSCVYGTGGRILDQKRISMPPIDETEIRDTVSTAIEKQNVISLITYYLSDHGEGILKMVISSVLEKYGRIDLMDIVYTAAKELITNATKANVKRLVFIENGLDPAVPEEYESGLNLLRSNMLEENIKAFKPKLKKAGYRVTISFNHTPLVLIIIVRNSVPLLPQEEERIREKFRKAQSYENLFDFYLEHGDQTEGAGLGLTLVSILLDQSGIEKHAFTLYYDEKSRETAARLEIPLNPDYVPLRRRFEEKAREAGEVTPEMRQTFLREVEPDVF